ncbi:hypothetical protein [Solitalea lacus]|uniref:hypothetical protein n=1 Tax=Solitalea lacus TaxID=2911172 RepID=UPI001EDB6128|nr:hypothetical protein [Solitalea lacus]UKJ07882.1 hypothetical protein L2B55_01645 [Solitalea lacus]
MSEKEDLTELYARYTNEELLDLLNARENYTDLAVRVAFEELKNRNLGEQEIKDYITSKFKKAEQFIAENIHNELSLQLKSYFYFFWLPIFTFPFQLNYKEERLILKLKQSNFYSLMGFCFFTIGTIGYLFLGFSLLSALAIWVGGIIMAMVLDHRFNRNKIIRDFERTIRKYQNESSESGTNENS